MDKKKVLLISHMPPPTTGIGSWTRRVLAGGIPGYEIGFVNSNMIGGRDPFQNTRRRMKDEWQRCLFIWKEEARELKNDPGYIVVHTNIPCTAFGMIREFITGLIAKRYKKKFVLHCHCTVPNVVYNAGQKLLFCLLMTCVDGTIVLNKKSESFVKKYTAAPVRIIPNFVEANELCTEEEKAVRERMQTILFVGGVSPDKGCDTIIEAAKQLPEYRFRLVGLISEEIGREVLPGNVELTGNQPKEKVQQHMREADLFLFLSRYFGEGFSVALVEAMAAGLPCVVTDWAANADMVGNGGGRVIPHRNAQALVEAIQELATDPQLRKKQSIHNIKKVKTEYIGSAVLPQYAAIYEETISL